MQSKRMSGLDRFIFAAACWLVVGLIALVYSGYGLLFVSYLWRKG